MANILTLPTLDNIYTDHFLFSRYSIPVGQSLLITSDVGTLTQFPSQDEIRDADFYFGGGRRHVLSSAEHTAVVAAGYSSYVSVE